MPNRIDSISDFIQLVKESCLAQLDEAETLSEFRREYLPQSNLPECAASFGSFLVARGVLTPWQCEKLRNSQYIGFYYHGFVLLDHLRFDDQFSYYLAREIGGRRGHLEIAVRPPKSKGIVEEWHVVRQLD